MRLLSCFRRALPPAFVLLALAMGLSACGEDLTAPGDIPTVPGDTPTANRIEKVAGQGQSAPAGTELPEPVQVRVTSQDGTPIPDVGVAFEVVEGEGSVSPGTTRTDEQGLASARWTLGPDASASQRLKAYVPTSAGGDGSATLVTDFSADATAGDPDELEASSGDGQIVPTGRETAQPLTVTVRDRHGNPIEGQEVTWSVVSGGGSVVPSTSTSDSTGRASTIRKVGDEIGVAKTRATIEGVGSVTFTTDVVEGSDIDPASIEIFEGDGQSAPVGTAPPTPYSVRVTSADGFPVEGAVIQWQVGKGGGRVKPTTSETTPDGIATTARQFGDQIGEQTTIAMVFADNDLTVTFHGTATAGPPSELVRVSGDGQTGGTGAALPDPLRVKVVDAGGHPVEGVDVQWAVLSGGGQLSSTRTPTDSGGAAEVQWTLGSVEGEQQAEASVSGLASSPLTFTATALGEPPTDIQSVSGDGQSGGAGQPLDDPYVVRVVDAAGAPVEGAIVDWRVAVGDGGSIDASQTTTDGSGEARVTATLPGTVGASQTVIAEAAAVTGDSAIFTSTVTENASGVASLTLVSGDGQAGTAGQPLDNPFVARAADASGSPVPGATIQWSVTSNDGGSVDPTSSTTGGSGEAQATGTLPGTVGDVLTVEATAPGVTDTLRFTATVTTPGDVATLAKVSGDGQTGTVGQPLSGPYRVRALDANGDPLLDVTVQFEPVDPATDGSVSPVSVSTDGSGEAETTHTLGDKIGTHDVRAFADGQEVFFSAQAVGPNGEADMLQIGGDGQEGEVGEPLPEPYVVQVLDAAGQPVSGVTVNWRKQMGDGGSINPSQTTTDGTGQAQITATMPQSTGETQTVFATSPALPDTVSFTSTATNSTAPSHISVLSGDGQTGRVRQILEDSLFVTVTDSNGAVVGGAEVEWNLASRPAGASFGDLSTPRNTTNANGEAGVWYRLGDTPGDYVIEATVAGAQQTAQFTVTAVGDPTQLVLVGGDGQSAAPGETFSNPLVVRARNSSGQPVPGVDVEFSVTTADGGGVSASSFGPFTSTVTVATDSQGRASVFRRVGSSASSGDPVDTEALLPNFTGVTPVTLQGSAQ